MTHSVTGDYTIIIFERYNNRQPVKNVIKQMYPYIIVYYHKSKTGNQSRM